MVLLAKFILYFQKKFYLSLLFKNKRVKCEKTVKFGDVHYFEIHDNIHSVTIRKDVKFYSHVNITVGENAILNIDENTTINKYTSIVALEQINIGHNCLIGENVKIYDNNHRIDTIDNVNFPNHKKFVTAAVNIGNHVWIASNVTILKGVTIGNNAVIGAGCTIYKDVPDNSIIVNNQNLITK